MNASTTRSTAAKKTATAAPARKTTAAPKRPAAGVRKTTAKKPAPRKTTTRRPKVSLVKPATMQARRERRTLHPDFTDGEVYAARAALHATMAGIPAPISGWTPSLGRGAEQVLPGGIRLRHGGRHGDAFSASVPCLLGSLHVYDDIRSAADLEAAVRIATTCDEPHTDLADLAFGTDEDPEATVTIPLQQAHAATPAAEPAAEQDAEA